MLHGRFLLRVLAMASKELVHIRRDPRTLYMALGMPVVMLLLFGFGLGFDLDRIPILVVDGDRSLASRRLRSTLEAGSDLDVVGSVDAVTAERILRRGQAVAAVVIPAGYARDMSSQGAASMQLLVDGSDANLARQVMAKVEGILTSGTASAAQVSVRLQTLWNPAGKSSHFLVPGLAAYLLAIAAVLLTALTVAGEWERGSMEQLFASPIGRLEIVLGKLVPYLLLGMLQLLVLITLAALVFDVPVQGSVGLLFLAGLLFLVAMLGQGLLISVVARNQLVATQAGALSSLLPSLVLSGMMVPIENMPRVIQALTLVVPGRYLVHALRTLMLKGGGLSTILVDLLAMAAFALVMLGLATAKFKRRLA